MAAGRGSGTLWYAQYGSARSGQSSAFQIQAAVSFALSLGAFFVAIFYLPVGGSIRGFPCLDVLYLTTSAFTLAKCIRDNQESRSVTNRVDQAPGEKLLAEHDRFGGAPVS
jgi:hypothetical protein